MKSIPIPYNLNELAKNTMIDHSLLPDYPLDVLDQVKHLNDPAKPENGHTKDLRQLPWFSLDNDDSRDLDQLTYAEKINTEEYRIYVAVADVDALVKKDSPSDRYAQYNTTSVYTPTKVFSMLHEHLSTDLTSLNEGVDRMAVVIEVQVNHKGKCGEYKIYSAYVHNHAKLAYNSISDWLDGLIDTPEKIKNHPEIQQQVILQDTIAKKLRRFRNDEGALTLQTIEPKVVLEDHSVVDVKVEIKNRGRELIEDFMIAANRSTALFLNFKKLPSFRRVVRIPKRWDRIVEIAAEKGFELPVDPDSKSLEEFLSQQRLLDPLHFPDLSLTIIKLLGNGEYIVEYPGESPVGHFGLAVKTYSHSTAPNRRYPDIITQRLLKSTLESMKIPYTIHELENLASHCTEKEDEAEKVERKMKKSAACVVLSHKIHQNFDGLVTGASDKGTWVRIFHPPVEGKLVGGYENVDIGDKIIVKLMHVDIEKGFIDFIREK